MDIQKLEQDLITASKKTAELERRYQIISEAFRTVGEALHEAQKQEREAAEELIQAFRQGWGSTNHNSINIRKAN